MFTIYLIKTTLAIRKKCRKRKHSNIFKHNNEYN